VRAVTSAQLDRQRSASACSTSEGLDTRCGVTHPRQGGRLGRERDRRRRPCETELVCLEKYWKYQNRREEIRKRGELLWLVSYSRSKW